MSKFKEILEKIDPEKKVFTEEIQKELISMMEQKEKALYEEAYAKSFKEVTEKTAAQLKEADVKAAALDKDRAEKMKTLVEKVKAKYEEKINKMDEDHANKMKDLFEKVDTDHYNKMKKIVEAIDADHTKKLEKINEHYKNKAIDSKIVEGVSKFMDTYIDEKLPKEKAIKEAKLARLESFYAGLKELVLVNDDYIQTEIKEAVKDAADKIKAKDEEINKLMLEKVELTSKINKNEAQTVLESKSKDLTPAIKAYIETRFKDADKKEIEEKFDEAVKAFKTEEKSKRETIIAEAQSKAKVQAPVITEEKKPEAQPETESKLSKYADVLAKANKKNTWR